MRKQSATFYVLSALMPYTKANLKLSFKPSAFFAELESIEKIRQPTLKTAYTRAVKQKLIEVDEQNIPHLTSKGKQNLGPFIAKKLSGARLMVIFDIPESERWKRQKFRSVLREFQFKQIQKSVWSTSLDCKEYLQYSVSDLGIAPYVELFEARKIV